MLNTIFSNTETFFFVFVRVLAILSAIPFLGGRSVPMPLKMGVTIMLAILIVPTITTPVPIPETLPGIVFSVFREILIGLTLGLAARMVIAGFELAGQLGGIQMGFAMANVVDPHTSGQLSVVAQVYNMVGIFIFFALNVHLIFIGAIKECFLVVPPFGFSLNETLYSGILQMGFDIFKIALKLAAPISISILLANLAMGILARTVPQLNIFVVGFPVTITLGLVMLFFAMPYVVSTITSSYGGMSNDIFDLLRTGAH